MIANLNNQPLPDQNPKQVQSQISGVLVALDDPFDKMVWDYCLSQTYPISEASAVANIGCFSCTRRPIR